MAHDNISHILSPLIQQHQEAIDAWFEHTFRHTPALFYTSVDIRHSGFKVVPVDTNVFPAGFNNLSERGRERAIDAAAAFLSRYYPDTARILIVPENHTRNTFYLDNVAAIYAIMNALDGVEVVIGTAAPEIDAPMEVESASGTILTLHPLVQQDGVLSTISGFVPDVIVTNNDFTDGAPAVLSGISQPVIPPIGMGWYQRRKTSHFDTYNQLVRRFCQVIDIDPWLISTVFEHCGKINFKEQTGIECIALNVDKAIHKISEKYAQYGITKTPYVFIKSDRGTYGMGIMTVRSGEELYEMNKKNRNKMNKIKGGEVNSEVIIQEGVPTIDVVDGHSAEHMVYLVGGKAVNCIYRINEDRDEYSNLNSSGMRFQSMQPKEDRICDTLATIAKLASYAAAWECYEQSYSI